MLRDLILPMGIHRPATNRLRAGRVGLLFLGLFLATIGNAGAHPMPPDVTMAQLNIHYHLIDMNLRIPANEVIGAAAVTGADLVGEGTAKPVLDKLSKWLPEKLSLDKVGKDGKTLTPEVVSADYRNFSAGPECTLVVHYKTDKPAERLHVTSYFVHTIVSTNGVQFEMHSDKETQRTFDTKANLSSIWRNIEDFFNMGMEHLFTGPDHILFICTLIFALMDFKSVVKMLTGFTVGHSITLILTTFNVFTVPPQLADMGIALTIVYVALENIFRKEMPRRRWLIVFIFGLIHGMGFSSALREVGLPQQGLVLCLLSFNLGIEVAQIIIVAGVYPILSRLRWYKEALYGPQGLRQFKTLLNFGSAFTACMGGYWFVERLLGH